MGQRSSGVTALALLATVQGIYGFVAAIALLFGGTLGMFVQSPTGVTTTLIGALFLALGLASFGLGAGLWMRKPWAWTAGLVVYVAWVIVNLATLFVGASIFSVIMPVVLGVGVVWFLLQPRIKDELLGTTSSTTT